MSHELALQAREQAQWDADATLIGHIQTHAVCTPDCPVWKAGKALDAGRLHTVEEAAEALTVSKMTLYRAIHAGELAAVKIGRSYRVTRPAVFAFLGES